MGKKYQIMSMNLGQVAYWKDRNYILRNAGVCWIARKTDGFTLCRNAQDDSFFWAPECPRTDSQADAQAAHVQILLLEMADADGIEYPAFSDWRDAEPVSGSCA